MAPVLKKHVSGMHRTISSTQAILETLGNRLGELEDDIKADEAGKVEFDRLLAQLEDRRRQTTNRIEINTKWTAGSLDGDDVAPLEEIHRAKIDEVAAIVGDAKAKHKTGIKLLKDAFSYHPEFFRPNDTFRATPFVPMRSAKRLQG